MKNRKVIRLTESDLHNIIEESVNEILMEYGDTPLGQYQIGRVLQRRQHVGKDNQDVYDHFLPQYPRGDEWDQVRERMAQGMVDQEHLMNAVDSKNKKETLQALNDRLKHVHNYREQNPQRIKQRQRQKEKSYNPRNIDWQ